MLDLSTECLELLEILEELELIEFWDLDRPIPSLLLLSFPFSFFGRDVMIEILVQGHKRVVETVVHHSGLPLLPPLNELLLSLIGLSLLLLDDGLHFLSFLSVVLVLKEEHVSRFNIKVKGVGQLLSLLSRLLLKLCEL